MGSYINQHVLNNLFYILVSVFVFYFIYDHGEIFKKRTSYRDALLAVCMGLPIILCMKFPIYIDEQCIHDFRQIPFLVGTLYGGGIVGFILLLTLLAARSLIYGFEYITAVVYMTMFIIAALVSPTFKALKRSNKLSMSVWLTLFLAVLTTFLAIIIAQFQVTDSYIVYFILLPPIGMLFVVYIMETLKEAIIMRSKLVKVEKMEVVSQLAASISHEIRNPLTVVKGFIQLLKTPSLSQDAKDRYIQIALDEINRAEAIINEYLTFAKPASNKVERLMVDDQLRKVIQMLAPMAHMNSIEIVEELQPGAIVGNIQYFQQCFLNLIKNSIEAMPNGGTLTISSRLHGDHVIITIKDTGVGMTTEQVNRFGEPYFSTKEKGTGLGTMVAVKMIQTMQGTLHIQSEVNKGTTLTITFPKAAN
ncbi:MULTISPECIES: HAMP domain-containing sensor histidine kinase [unclassified Geobacillus]|uniref:sensor histidine kinase n=1 Tax=unclassified Geobacillus TaxID=2642459 RepID=UPI000BE25179|nr:MULTISPECIES: HAMP domain-containing sensor histidine kinase [unclassified Geobacillus]PDM40805.1 two-component sensor histidine kinase [Parageobacillus yumthangensis]PUF89380.1 sensor histidine kinase [Geobacillus sp. LYN3]RDV23844.1 sensor histidine kinase [Parageobacillus toebii]TXK87998.1 HAMP domain-containing histidine kinase [Geobacillus sp. AYS3]